MIEPLFVDIETEPTQHDKAYPVAAIATVGAGFDGPVSIVEPAAARALVERWTGPIVGHNIAFDLTGLGVTTSRLSVPVFDTYIRDVLLGAASGRHADASSSLKRIAARAGYKMPLKDKSLTLSFGGTCPGSLTPEQREYAMDDVRATRVVFASQGLKRVSKDEARQTQLAVDIYHMARRGVAVDRERVLTMRAEADAKVAAYESTVKTLGLIGKGSRKELQRRLKEAGVVRLPKRRATDTRDPSGLLAADGATLRATGDPGLVAFADYAKAKKWADLVASFDVGGDMIRAWWRPIVASGRLSCSGPNLTQVPRVGGLRECIVPRPGNKLVIMDFAALEFRVWAATCQRWLGFSEAAKMLRAREDVHDVVARAVIERLGGDFVERRQLAAKPMNYGLIGGMSVGRLAATLKSTKPEADLLFRLWKSIFWEYGPYVAYLKKNCVAYPKYEVELPSGRVRQAFYTEIANVVIQGGGADVAKDTLRLAHRAGLPVVCLPHDEFLIDVPPGQADEAGHHILECAEEAGLMHYPEVPWDANEYKVVDRWPSKKA